MDWQRNYSVFMDIREVQKLMEEQRRWEQERSQEGGFNQGTRDQTRDRSFDTALIKCADFDSVYRVKEVLDEWGFPNSMPAQQLESMRNIANSLQTFLAGVGAVALLVSALGITNTMVTAIYERTKEIGVMKVIGATLGDIRKLFLMEAALLGFVGGLAGVAMSLAVSYFINTSGVRFLPESLHEFANQTTVSLVTLELCAIAVLFSTVMGIVAGFVPANRAMKLSVLTAIRTE
jgi:predicted lysophospholipase L1 biosynthesis ABC-type transport system permease subunit